MSISARWPSRSSIARTMQRCWSCATVNMVGASGSLACTIRNALAEANGSDTTRAIWRASTALSASSTMMPVELLVELHIGGEVLVGHAVAADERIERGQSSA